LDFITNYCVHYEKVLFDCLLTIFLACVVCFPLQALSWIFFLMASVPGTTNEATLGLGKPFVFPYYENVGPLYITTLSLPSLTIGFPLWLFSTLVIPNATSASVVITSSQEHQPHVDPSPSSPVRASSTSSLPMSSFVSSSLPSERSATSNLVDKKNKKNKKGFKLPTTARHVGKQPVTDNRVGSVDDAKIT
jgi:hypothetical protein